MKVDSLKTFHRLLLVSNHAGCIKPVNILFTKQGNAALSICMFTVHHLDTENYVYVALVASVGCLINILSIFCTFKRD